MTGSAKQSSAAKQRLDCFVASAPRNDGWGAVLPDEVLNSARSLCTESTRLRQQLDRFMTTIRAT
jgi:hypothetical protein